MAHRVGIVSANWGAVAHLPAWRALPDVEVVGICTSRRETAERAAADHGIARAFWDVDAMAADPGIDILDVGTRPVLRETMLLSCLAHGKHVYAGIPQAAGIDGARAVHAAWRAGSAVGVVDAYSEWLPAHRLARELIEGGEIGRPFGGTCTFSMSLFNELRAGFPYNWFAEGGQGVSAVRNLGSHAFHLLVSLFGPVDELVAHDGRLLDEWRSADGATLIPAETNDFATVMLRFASGLVIQFLVSWNAPLGPGWSLDVFGSKGRMLVEGAQFPTPAGTTIRFGRLGEAGLGEIAIPERLRRAEGIGIGIDAPVPPAFPMALAMRSMIDAIEGRGAARPDFEQAWQVERIQEAVRVSAAERRWVKIAGIG